MGDLVYTFNESFRVRAQPKEELGSSILTSATSHSVSEALLLVSVPNKPPPQLQRQFFIQGFGHSNIIWFYTTFSV